VMTTCGGGNSMHDFYIHNIRSNFTQLWSD
jgi:hypothetical protein